MTNVDKILDVEQALANSERRFRETADLLPVAVFETDTSFILTYMNKRGFEITGYSQSDMGNGLSILDLIVEEDREIAVNYLGSVINDRQKFNGIEYTAVRKNGDIYPLITISEPITSDDYKVVGVRCSGFDFTYRKSIEQKLEEINSELNQILNTDEAMCVISTDRKILKASRKFCRLFGLEPDICHYMDCSELLPVNVLKASQEALDCIKNGHDHYEVEIDILREDKPVPYLVCSSPFFYIDGITLKGLVTSFIDISEQKKAQQLKESSMAALIEAEQKKFEALQVIEETARLASIGVIAGGITHEINQPLNAIKIGADSILIWDEENRVLPEVITKVIKNISDAAERIDEIVRHMRSFWADDRENQIEIFDINPVLDRAVSFLLNRIKMHEIVPFISLSDTPLFIKANRLQLEIVVSNLVNNAIHSLDKKGSKDKQLRIGTFSKDDLIYLEIGDNGTGLPDVPVEMLFDPFFTTKGPIEGTGLGLAIVEKFVRKFGADIKVENLDEGGAAFTIVFKREKPA